jgi:predicted N-acyltransferase
MEDNRVLIKAGFESHISDFYKFIKTIGKKYCLEYISGQDDFTKTLPIIDFKYILPLDEFSSYEDYLAKYFKGKDLREFKRKIRNISENHKFEIITNNFSDLEYLFEYNINRFKDHSMFQRPYRKEIFRELVGLKFEPVVNSYIVDGKLEAVSMALIYRDTLESFNTGVSPNAPKNLREYIYILKIDHAIKKGLKKFDSFIRSYGWKEQWCFSKIPQYKFPEV